MRIFFFIVLFFGINEIYGDITVINNFNKGIFQLYSNNFKILEDKGFIWFADETADHIFLWNSLEDEGETIIILIWDNKIVRSFNIGDFSYKPINQRLGIIYLSEEEYVPEKNEIRIIDNSSGKIIYEFSINKFQNKYISYVYANEEYCFVYLIDVKTYEKELIKYTLNNFEKISLIKGEYKIAESILRDSFILIDKNMNVVFSFLSTELTPYIFIIYDDYYFYKSKENKLVKMSKKYFKHTINIFNID